MSAGWTEGRVAAGPGRALRCAGFFGALVVAMGCEQRLPDPPPPASHREPARAPAGALGARPASADDGAKSLLSSPLAPNPGGQDPEDEDTAPEIETDGGAAEPAPPVAQPVPPSNGVAL